MELECNSITKQILPAVRICIAEQLSSKYGMSQSEIANKLGIAQVAVSKYLNGKYSISVRKAKNRLKSSKAIAKVVEGASKASGSETVNRMVNELCARIVYDNSVS